MNCPAGNRSVHSEVISPEVMSRYDSGFGRDDFQATWAYTYKVSIETKNRHIALRYQYILPAGNKKEIKNQ